MHLLSYACCLLAATHLSSPSLGTFFGIPSWLGDPNVPSERTYGSPDATNATHRIDNDALKAVAALFEGFEERAYYASEGPSNVWDEAVWGPTARGANKVPFRFDYGRPDIYAFAYQPDDDRRVATRRFVEYDNVSRLAYSLTKERYESSANLWDRVSVRRPLWRGGASTQTDTTPKWVWSSTLFDTLRPGGVVPQIPTFEWSPTSSLFDMTSDEWGCALLSWDDVTRPNSDPLNWESGYSAHGSTLLIAEMINPLHYREPPFNGSRWIEDFGQYFRLTNTTCDVIDIPYSAYATWKDRKTAVAIADAIDDILQQGDFPSYGYSLAHGVYSAVSDKWGYYEIEPYETFSISVRAEPDPHLPFFLDDDGTVFYFWIFTDLTVTRDSTGETAHADSADGFHVAVQAPGCRREDYAEIRCETIGDLERSGGYFEGLAFYNGPGALANMWIYDLQIRGESPEMSYDLGTISYPVIRSNTISRVRDFTTNDTRRLVTDRVAGIGQALSGLDRTYAPMNADAPAAEVTRFSGDILLQSEPVAYGGLSWAYSQDYERILLKCSAATVPFTGFGEITNYLYVTNGPAIEHPGYVVCGCSESSDVLSLRGCQLATNIEFYTQLDGPDALYEIIGRPEPGQGPRVFAVTDLDYMASGFSGDAYFYASFVQDPASSREPVYRYQGYRHLTLPPEGIPLVANASYTRSYSYADSVRVDDVRFGTGDDGILYPGSFDRVKTADLWSMESYMSAIGSRVTISDPLFPNPYGSGCDSVMYRSRVDRYGTHSALLQIFRETLVGQAGKCSDYVEGAMRAAGVADFRNPFDAIPMREEDASAPLSGSVVPRRDTPSGTWTIAQLMAAPPPQGYSFLITVSDDGVWLHTAYGDLVPFPWPMTFVHLGLGVVTADWKDGVIRRPDCIKTTGAAAKAKTRGMSKVDWEWGALRRTSGNQ